MLLCTLSLDETHKPTDSGSLTKPSQQNKHSEGHTKVHYNQIAENPDKERNVRESQRH
jgi:hypothetical protein